MSVWDERVLGAQRAADELARFKEALVEAGLGPLPEPARGCGPHGYSVGPALLRRLS
jgi:hypothetical protein